ncbi:MAG: type III secretion system export apparatus subunit SctV [Myxococcota bacterium]
MRSILRGLQALPLGNLGRHPDLWLTFGVGAMITLLILPLPAALLDILLAFNIALAALILGAVLLSEQPLSLSSFPSILLLTTLCRLALNVSSTRLILTSGQSSEIVAAFGRFVVGGTILVGLLMFVVITMVQFIVIAKGAERVAEVGARFALDALPGRQMSIDASLRSGHLSDIEAQRLREDLSQESQFHGAMDGAMKFVKGDAIAGLIITGLNLVAGMSIGVFEHGMSVSASVRWFTLLTIGDGLVSQIPALLITVAAGIVTTRVGGQERTDLGRKVFSELTARPKVLFTAAGFSGCLAFVPGFPSLPFLMASMVFALVGWRRRFLVRPISTEIRRDQARAKAKEKLSQRAAASADLMINLVDPIGIDLNAQLTEELGFHSDARDEDNELVGSLIPELREVLFSELGVRFPSVRVRTHVPDLEEGRFVIRIKDVPLAEGVIDSAQIMVPEHSDAFSGLDIETREAIHPWGTGPSTFMAIEHRPLVEQLGYTAWTPAGQIALHLARVLRSSASSFVGLQETSEMVEKLEQAYPCVVREAVPKVVTVPQLTEILRRLVDERVSIKDLRTILETLVEIGDRQHDPVARTEHVRAALGRQIANTYASVGRQLSAVLLETALEETLQDAVTRTSTGSYLALEPTLQQRLVDGIAHTMAPAFEAGAHAVLLTRSEIRRYLRKAIETDLPDVAVLSFDELPADLYVQPFGRVVVADHIERI